MSFRKFSVINLVDFVGSDQIGAQSDNINKSLKVLGKVIGILADKSMGKAKNVFPPYRESQLTRILQNALGGNSKTLMICAISPATVNYEETLSTLRYADLAQKIKNCAVINESDVDKKLRQYQEEIYLLKQQLMLSQQQIQCRNLNPTVLEKLNQIQDDIETRETIMQENQESFQQKLQKQKIIDEENDDLSNEDIKNYPHLINLYEDPLLNRKIFKSLNQEEIILVGRMALLYHKLQLMLCVYSQTMLLLKIMKKSLKLVHTKKNVVTLYLQMDHQLQEQNYYIIMIDQYLEHQRHSQFKYQEQCKLKKTMKLIGNLPKNKWFKNRKKKEKSNKYDDFERKMKQLEEQNQDMPNKALIIEEERKLKDEQIKLEQESLQKQLAREKARKQYEDEETLRKQRIKEKNFIENKLQKYLPKVLEVNLIAKELKRNVTFEAKLQSIYADEQDFSQLTEENLITKEEGQIYFWDLHKFSNRYYIIKDLLERYFESNQSLQLPKEQETFWDPPEAKLLGLAF